MSVQTLWEALMSFSKPEGKYTIKPALARLEKHGLLTSLVCPFYTEEHQGVVDDLNWKVVRRFAGYVGKALHAGRDVVRKYELRATPADVLEKAPLFSRTLFQEFLEQPNVPELLEKSWALTERIAEEIRQRSPAQVEILVVPDLVDLEPYLPEIVHQVQPAMLTRFLRRVKERYPPDWLGPGAEERFKIDYLLYATTTWVLGEQGYVLLQVEAHDLYWDLGRFSLFAGRRLPLLKVSLPLRRWRKWRARKAR